MAFLSRVFRRDPRRLLHKAEGWLRDGQGVRALHAAENVVEGAEGRILEEAEDLARRAHAAIMNRALQEAKLSKEAGDLREAADWMGTAADHCDDEAQRTEIGNLRAAMLERAGRADEIALEEDPGDGEEPLGDEEIAYEMLAGTFSPQIADLYNQRPAELRAAVVAFHGGSPTEALSILENLLAEDPDDPVFRLEAGQCRLAMGQMEAAQSDFEAAGEALGDDALDAAGSLSIPFLLATTLFEGGKSKELLTRFEEDIDLEKGPAELGRLWARALLEEGRDAEALEAMLILGNRSPADAELAFELSTVLEVQGYEEEAIARLERVVAPGCSTGSCNRGALFLPAARRLAALYLKGERNPQRAGEVLAWVLVASGGRLSEEDLPLVERYRDLLGDEDLPELTSSLEVSESLSVMGGAGE